MTFDRARSDLLDYQLVPLLSRELDGDVDLSDDGDVIRALFAKGYSLAMFENLLDRIIAKARADRRREAAACALGLAGIAGTVWFWTVVLSDHAYAATHHAGPPHGWPGEGLVALAIIAVLVSAYAIFRWRTVRITEDMQWEQDNAPVYRRGG